MLVRCPGCQTGYRLDPARIPAAGLRVRCPSCGSVFRVRATEPAVEPAPSTEIALPGLEREARRPPQLGAPARLPTRKQTEAPRPVAAPARTGWSGERTIDFGTTNATEAKPRLETAPFSPGQTTATSVAAPPAPADTEPQAYERARRLARALVSDILVYHQEARDRALRQGNLASALGGEVHKAWELYKAKVDPGVLRTTSYFKDALNEILAAGQQVF